MIAKYMKISDMLKQYNLCPICNDRLDLVVSILISNDYYCGYKPFYYCSNDSFGYHFNGGKDKYDYGLLTLTDDWQVTNLSCVYGAEIEDAVITIQCMNMKISYRNHFKLKFITKFGFFEIKPINRTSLELNVPLISPELSNGPMFCVNYDYCTNIIQCKNESKCLFPDGSPVLIKNENIYFPNMWSVEKILEEKDIEKNEQYIITNFCENYELEEKYFQRIFGLKSFW